MYNKLVYYTQQLGRRTSLLLLIITVSYLLFLTILRWKTNLDWRILFFLGGGILGVYFLDLADILFKISPSPFKNVLFQAIFVPFSLFVLTSSGSLFGAGLIFSIFLSMLFGQWQEFGKSGNISNWFWIVKVDFPPKTQQIYFAVMSGIFIFLSLLFI
jgi:hypothetical protein